MEGLFRKTAGRLFPGIERGFAFGGFEQNAFASDAAAAEAGEGLDEADEGLRFGEERFGEGGGIKGGEDLGNAKGGDLLGGLVEPGVVVFADHVEEQLDLSLGILAALLFGEPELVAGFLPA